MINMSIIEGRIVEDLELKTAANGVEYIKFTLASKRNYSENSDFIDCICFKNKAKNLFQYMKKGSRITVTGPIQTNKYQDKNNNSRKSTIIVVETISYPDKKKPELNIDDIAIPES